MDPRLNPMISPYATFSNNPIYYCDPLGDTVQLDGSRRDIRQFIRQLNRTTGNKYGVDENNILYNKGNSSNISTDKKKSGELSKIVAGAINDVEMFNIPLVRNDPTILFDSYDNETVDVGDIAKAPRVMQAGIIAHFLIERMENPIDYSKSNRTNSNFNIAHNLALQAEEKVVNAMLGQPNASVIRNDRLINVKNLDGRRYPFFYIATNQYGSTTYRFKYSSRKVGQMQNGNEIWGQGGTIYGRIKIKK